MFVDKGQVAGNFKYRVDEVFEMILLSKLLTFFSRWNCFRLASHGANISKRILFRRICSKSDSMFISELLFLRAATALLKLCCNL